MIWLVQDLEEDERFTWLAKEKWNLHLLTKKTYIEKSLDREREKGFVRKTSLQKN